MPGRPVRRRGPCRRHLLRRAGLPISQASTSVLFDQLVGLGLTEALATVDSFSTMMTSRGKDAGDEDVIGDGIAFAGVSKYPARVKCALLGWLAFKDAIGAEC